MKMLTHLEWRRERGLVKSLRPLCRLTLWRKLSWGEEGVVCGLGFLSSAPRLDRTEELWDGMSWGRESGLGGTWWAIKREAGSSLHANYPLMLMKNRRKQEEAKSTKQALIIPNSGDSSPSSEAAGERRCNLDFFCPRTLDPSRVGIFSGAHKV